MASDGQRVQLWETRPGGEVDGARGFNLSEGIAVKDKLKTNGTIQLMNAF